MTAEDRERQLADAALECCWEFLGRIIREQESGHILISNVIREYGPLIFRAGADHILTHFDCYPKTK